MEYFFGNIKKMFNGESKLTWTQVLILGLIPLGQLWARIFYFNGSLDKWWLMFPMLLIPPFSFIPLLMMKAGFVKEGKGANPLDYWMIIPIVAKFVIPFIMPFMINQDSEILTSIVTMIFQMLCIMIANLARRHMNCKEQGITMDSIGKAGIDSTIAFGIGDISSLVIPLVPFVGIFTSTIEMIPFIGGFVDSILWTLGFVTAYVLINMFNQDNISNFCSTPFTGNLQDKIPFFISVAAIIGTKLFN